MYHTQHVTGHAIQIIVIKLKKFNFYKLAR